MSITNVLYSLFIEPIEILIQLAYSLVYDRISNAGLSIIGVSIVVSMFVLPLYLKSDRVQEEEQKKQKEMSYWVQRIRTTFSGDERFMMLQEYYRQQHYSPVYAIRGSISLLLQVPFFIAAYHYLSNLDIIQNTHFWKIPNLGAPDGLLTIGTITINVLPVIMTLVNLLSSAIYTKGFPVKTKITTFGLAFLFLILLYNSPSGLVIYWICNNVFSLFKNIATQFIGSKSSDSQIDRIGLKRPDSSKLHFVSVQKDSGTIVRYTRLFLIAGVGLSLLMGLLIPTSVISSSATEFIDASHYVNPLHYAVHTFCVYVGFFLIWGALLYYLASHKVKRLISGLYVILFGLFIVNYMFFGKLHGILLSNLSFESGLKYGTQEHLINTLICLLVIGFLSYLSKQKARPTGYLVTIVTISILLLSAVQIHNTQDQLKIASDYIAQAKANSELTQDEHHFDNIIQLSRTGQNVVVIMLDKAINQYVPFVFKERPDIKEAFEGFTYYPNTTSFGYHTNKGSAPLFGGYDYTPEKIQQRSSDTMAQKQNEALTLIPALLSEEGFHSVVIDPPYTNFQPYVDPTIYDGIDNTACYAAQGYLLSDLDRAQLNNETSIKEWGFVFYSLFKTVPTVLQPVVYDSGDYHTTTIHDSMNTDFLRAYSVLDYLPEMTQVVDDGKCLFMFMNETAHDPRELQLPDYVPALSVDNSRYLQEEYLEADGIVMHRHDDETFKFYHANMAAYIKLAEWLNYLRREGVYDNTRIIIVSDHGARLHQFEGQYLPGGEFDLEGLAGLLLYKDFGDKQFIVDESFMTVADTPTLAIDGFINSPVNPYTGNPINMVPKSTGDFMVTTDGNASHKGDGYHIPIISGYWYKVKDNIYDLNNWTRVENPEF